MRYRRFGKTNLLLSVFSLGTMRCLASMENARKTVESAIANGVNHLETARGYGKSEEYLGTILRDDLSGLRSQLYITTKIPPTPHPDLMRQWLDESLQRLQVDYLDCLAIHGINTWEHLAWVESPHGCLKPIEEALADGKIKHLGFSTHAPLEVIIAAINTDLFQFVNLHYYYFFQHNLSAIELAHQKDMGIFIISPADKGGKLYNPPAKLEKLSYPFSPLELNYRFLLSDSRITTLSFGPANPDELLAPLALANRDQPLNDREIEAFCVWESQAKNKLGTDRCSQCYKCLPCPENINIPEVLRLRNLAVAYDMNDYGKYRYQMFENAGHWFPGVKGNRCTNCSDCLPHCPEKLDIPRLLMDTHNRLNGSPRRRLWE
ncbi:MAG TPA: oxidoreductase [Cyanobacteria bacterium UBA11149]|nr:oxidoreductase [Cyanobacteria bacterium UBA11367]HBE56576.1 oxidoreductase [Cyanobacteria bacterium UBA11366]HBK65038.1 oxidoreductase [Cyanobacteria bacterium UBA11166]HBR72427.1 oxidoreductase [Cyanobacteria bacterium UBA11159]HBS68406.1 oxidoreductase [Cyanobacteria bacterium UBA11153]HBW87360.1 oxidoreductase [Cyanobacteria bacterium UBA11149]HCA93185.1 oxidoreductase [Cyanobacteria bacterium UBA9226]